MEFVEEIKGSSGAFIKTPKTFAGLAPIAARNGDNPARILISRPNHRLGNLLLVTPLIEEITATLPTCKIDLFVRGDLPLTIFKTYRNIDRIIKLPKRAFPNFIKYFSSWISIRRRHYDLAIDVDKNSSSGWLSIKFANARHKIFGDSIKDLALAKLEYQHHAKYPVYNFRNYLTKLGLQENIRPVPPMNLRLTGKEIEQGKKLLWQLVANTDPTIALFTYATGMKCYPSAWWVNFYEKIKKEYPRLNIIEILPINNVSKLSFAAPAFYSKDIRQIGSLIANTELFVAGDSGIMHLASAVGTPTIGLFSVTDRQLYAPYDNGSIGLDTNIAGIDELMNIIGNMLRSPFTRPHVL